MEKVLEITIFICSEFIFVILVLMAFTYIMHGHNHIDYWKKFWGIK